LLAGNRDVVLVGVLFTALVASGVVSYLNHPTESGLGVSYSTYSADRDGTLALYLWLARLGYRVRRVQSVPYALPADLDAVFVVVPSLTYTADEAAHLLAWVRGGGTAILALDRSAGQAALLRAFGARLDVPPAIAGATPPPAPAQPVLDAPPVRRLAPLPLARVAFAAPASVTYLIAGASRAPVLVGRRLGRGRVFLLGAPALLSNTYIRQADDRLVPLNLLSSLRRDAAIGFDEFHHGVQVQQAQSAADLLFSTAPGRALLYAGAIVLIYLALSGRRLGPPVVARRPPARSISEYIVSLGALYRRSGARADALAIVTRAFLLGLAETYHLPPVANASQAPSDVVRALRERGVLDGPRAVHMQALLEPPRGALSEAELLRRVCALDSLRADLHGEQGRQG
jgi:hypothetical protein